MKTAILVGLAALCLGQDAAGQSRFEALSSIDVGFVKNVGPVGALGGSVVMRHRRAEVRAGASRFGMMTGCMGFCDLGDASVWEAGAGIALGGRSIVNAWTAGALIARVHERFDTPRAMASGYLRRPWVIHGVLTGSTEVRAHVVRVRGFGPRPGWLVRLGLGLGIGGAT